MSDDESTRGRRWHATLQPRSPLDSPPPSVGVEAVFGARSRRGPLRSVNDDNYLIVRNGRYQETLMTSLPEGEILKRFDEYGYGMVIADGMGVSGEAASRLAISTLMHLAIFSGKWHVRVDEPIADEMIDRAERFYRSVDSALLQASRDGPPGLQTTLTVVYSAGTDLFYAHVGHSRAYLFRDGLLTQLTRDHTLDRDRADRAVIMDVAMSARDQHHIVTETIGGTGADVPRIDVERLGLLDRDLILLCTNGLTDVAEDARIAETLRAHTTPDDQCRALVDLAANSGGNDDVTALVAQYHIRA